MEIHTHLAGGVEGRKGIIASFPPDYVTAPDEQSNGRYSIGRERREEKRRMEGRARAPLPPRCPDSKNIGAPHLKHLTYFFCFLLVSKMA